MRAAGLVAGVLTLAAAIGGCAQLPAEPGASPAPSPTPTTTGLSSPSRPPKDNRLVASATVLDDGRGPQLCVGVILQSLPPQCGGPPIDGWVWPRSGVERRGGVTWGSFFVVGKYSGKRFRFDRLITAGQAAASLPVEKESDFSTPCPEPAGGWRPVDATRIGPEDQEKVFALAEQLPGYGGAWVDDQGNSAQPPETTVVNIRVTHDLETAARRLRTVWGGPLCVPQAEHSDRELKGVLDAVTGRYGFLSGGYSQGLVEIEVVYDDGTLQRKLDRRFGVGMVAVNSALRPYLG